MRAIPKFASGGLDYLRYTLVDPVRASAALLTSTAQPSKSNGDNELTEKDFFNMIKDIDGLPNEMMDIIGDLSSIFKYQSITGETLFDLNTAYLNTLYRLKVANQNKTVYDKTMEKVLENGSLNEPAIAADGGLYTLNSDGSIVEISPSDWAESPDDYNLVTVSNLMNMRAYDASMVNNPKVFNVALNSMGFESFDAMLDEIMEKIGSTTNTLDVRMAVDPNLAQELLRQLGQLNIDYYTFKTLKMDQDSKDQINNLLTYLVSAMPLRAKTWAIYKTRIPNGNEAAYRLAYNYLSGQASETHQLIQYEDPKTAKGSGASGGGSGNSDNQEANFWYGAITGEIGKNDFNFEIMVEHGSMTIENAIYSATAPGLDKDRKLGDFLTESGIDYVRDGTSIGFGNKLLSPESYDHVMVDRTAGMVVVELPVTDYGIPWFAVMDKFAEAMHAINEARAKGLPIDILKLLYDKGLDRLYDESSHDHFNHAAMQKFAVFRGITDENVEFYSVTHNKVTGAVNYENIPLKKLFDHDKEYFLSMPNASKETHERVSEVLGDKNVSKEAKLYRALIYVPLNNNMASAALADKTKLTRQLMFEDANEYQGSKKGGMVYGGMDITKPFLFLDPFAQLK